MTLSVCECAHVGAYMHLYDCAHECVPVCICTLRSKGSKQVLTEGLARVLCKANGYIMVTSSKEPFL